MFKSLLFFILITNFAHAAGLIVKSISASGYSNADVDATSLEVTTIYGGIAGAACTGDDISTCNSCTSTSALYACNTQSVYPTLPLRISFKLKEAASNAVAQYSIVDSGGTVNTTVSLANVTGAAESTVSFQLTWADICSAGGLTTSCIATATPYQLITKTLSFGVDSNANGSVDSDEKKSITIKLHIIPATAAASAIAQTQCPNGAADSAGLCFVKFAAGDAKIFVEDNPQPQISSADTTTSGGSIDWDGLAVFPIAVADASADVAAITSFTSGSVQPITRPVVASDGSIPNSEITGGIQNYQRYCFVYGSKNKAQNIYKFVAGSPATADAATIATNICLVPSENVGVLDDKSCFISTAAFGSDMAFEVKTFRQFRSEFLMKSDFGKLFVHYYYKLSPPLADFISQNELLKSITRGFLYPAFVFSYIALQYGLLAAILTLIVMFILIFHLKKLVNQKSALMFLFIFALSPLLKAQVEPQEKVIQHQEAQNGLVRIKKDGTYVYENKKPFKNESSRISFGQAQQPEITIDIEKTSASGVGTGEFKTFNFDDFYGGSSNLMIGYDYEWFPWVNKGKLGLQGGASVMFAQGNGRQLASLEPSKENYSFFTIPITFGAVYRFEYKDKQLLAPYASGGGTYTVLIEKREDKPSPNYTAAPGFYAAGGLLINVSALDEESGYALDSEYGIGNLWVSVEYRLIEVNSDAFDFSTRYLNAGLSFDF